MADLIPQSGRGPAIEISVFAVVVWLLQLWSARQMIAAYSESRRPLRESMIAIAIGGIFSLMRHPAGAYWIAWGMVTTFILSVINTWVLLVETLR